MDDRPEIKYLNRHIVEKVCISGPEVWLHLGIQLLDKKDLLALNVIESDVTNLRERCVKMFELWLEIQPHASWRKLISAMKNIHMYNLALDVEKLFTNEKPAVVDHQVFQEGECTQLSLNNAIHTV